MAAIFTYTQQLYDRNIRLIRMDPADRGGYLSCSLVYLSLEDTPKYNALSYVWGDQSQLREILCDGLVRLVTESLFQALSRIRKGKHNHILLWVDALCINQSDTKEKTQQVRLMRDIYKQAETVIIWLGEEQPGDRKGYGLACELCTEFGVAKRAVGDLPNELITQLDNGQWSPKIQAIMEMKEEWIGLVGLLNRPWFSRMWIIQELVVARSTYMLAGEFEIETDTLLKAGSSIGSAQAFIRHMYTIGANAPGQSIQFACVGALDSMRANIPNLIALTFLSLKFHATEPRDRIFALAGITDAIPLEVINYEKPVASLNKSHTRRLLECTDPTEVLCWVSVLPPDEGEPSWTPKWTAMVDELNPVVSLNINRNQIQTPGEHSVRFAGENTLVIMGKILDTIRKVGTKPPMGYLSSLGGHDLSWIIESLSAQQSWFEEMLQICQGTQYITGISTKEALWRTLILDGGFHNNPAPADYGQVFEHMLEANRKLIDSFRSAEPYKAANQAIPAHLDQALRAALHESDKSALIQSLIGRIVIGHRIAVTSQGYIGWVPESTKVDDGVVSFSGSGLPMILRPKNSSTGPTIHIQIQNEGQNIVEKSDQRNRWLVVGDAYVHGLMGNVPYQREDIESEEIFID